MDDTFNGPTETKMHYVFNFYFGVPVQSKDSSLEYWTVERGEWIGDYKEDSDVAKNWTWAEIKSHIPSYTIPEDKIMDYWWYSSNSITWKEDSFIRKLDDNPGLILESYDIYLALKDKESPITPGFVPSGEYELKGTAWAGYKVSFSGSSCTISYPFGDNTESKTFDVVPDIENNPYFQDFGGGYPKIRIFYNLTGKYQVKLYTTSRKNTNVVEWSK